MATARPPFLYVIALGSNRPHGRHGRPASNLSAALTQLAGPDLEVVATAPIIASAPVGPSLRTYANSACLIRTRLMPTALLTRLKQVERDFGRRRGQRWGSRVLDLDIILWSGGRWQSRNLTIPHRLWRERDFVVSPVASLVPTWRDPLTGLTTRQLAFRRNRPIPVDPSSKRA